MGDEAVRSQVLDAMRRSRVNEHKLVLQDFIVNQDAVTLVAAAAAGAEMSPATFRALIAKLPRLDFYASFESHRLTWKGTPDIQVAAIFDPDAATITTYSVDGRPSTLQKGSGAPAAPLLILHPAEPTLLRASPQPDMPGNVIQEPTDGALAASSSQELRSSGFSASLNSPEAAGAQSSFFASNTYINHFNIQEGDGWFGDSEMQFHSYSLAGYHGFVQGERAWYLITDASCPIGSYYRNGVVEDRGYDGLFLISPGVTNVNPPPPCNGYYNTFYGIHIIEIDGGGTGENDDFGWRFYASGPYPFGATVGTVYSYYANTMDPGPRTAYLRIVYN